MAYFCASSPLCFLDLQALVYSRALRERDACTWGIKDQSTASAHDVSDAKGKPERPLSTRECHGKSGKGDGPAAPALKKTVPNLTNLAAINGGEFPRKQVEDSITGESSTIAHRTLDMPSWGRQLEDIRYGHWNTKHRQSFAKQKIYNLTEYLSTIQKK